ncbi:MULTISPECIES: hypothetical protein [unclassified Streptomyces]|uniref:hypothetical protein n=1 Tax=unclassified Streptomyces TaxID=2593676 RepID=UPI0036504E8A
MYEQLVERMREYLDAGLALDVDRLDALYDPGFENLRTDEAGRSVTLTKAQFMARFRALREQGRRLGDSVDDVTFPGATAWGDQASVVMRRVEDGVPALYQFVWRMEDGRPTTLIREFTFEKDLSALLRLVEA